MAGVEVPSINIFFGLGYGSGDYFTLDDPVKGILDNVTYLIADEAGDGVEVGGDAVSFNIQRGRSRELDEIQTGTAVVTVENWDRVYDALNVGVDGWVTLPGTAGNYLSVPDEAALDIVGDLCVVAHIAPDDWTPAASQTIVSKYLTTAGNNRSWRLDLTTSGLLQLIWSADGTATITKNSTANLSALANGAAQWVAFALDIDNGAAGNDVRFWTSTDGTIWTQLGTTVTTAGVTSIFSSTAAVTVSGINAGTSSSYAGIVYDVSVRDGIGPSGTVGGTEVLHIDGADWPADTATTFPAATGQTVTVHRSGTPDTAMTPTTDTPYLDDLTVGKRITIAMHGVTLFDGSIENIDVEWPVGAAPTATFTAEDALGTLARKEFNAWTATAAQTAGDRLTDILNRPEVAFSSMRDLDVGINTLQGDNITWGSNVLNYAQLVVKSDLGRLFASRDGQLTFRNRHSLIGTSVEVAFRDDWTGVEFVGITTANGSRYLANRVGVDREGGTLQTVVGDTSLGVRALSLTGLLMDTDVQSYEMADFLLGVYEHPSTRIATIDVDVTGLADANKPVVAALDIGSKAEVVWTPAGVGAVVDQHLAVEGVDHSWSSWGHHRMTVKTSPAFQTSVFVLDDDSFGVLDAPDFVLAF